MARNGYFGMRRRRDEPVDPFSDEARFPSLFADREAQVQVAGNDIEAAAQQHALGMARGAGSIEARNDPLRYGSTFTRQYPGVLDAFKDSQLQQQQQQQQAVGMERLQPGPMQAVESATDRYARSMGYDTANNTYDPKAAGTYVQQYKTPVDLSLQRKRKNPINSFEVT